MIYHIDGFTIGGNPSKTGGGYTVFNENNQLLKRKEILKTGFTNNEGEMLGIKYAVIIASQGDTVLTDSKCAIAWAKAGKSKARPDLNNLLKDLKEIITYKNIKIEWIGRDSNLAGIYNEFG